MTRNIPAEAVAKALAGCLGQWLAPLTARVPWPVRLGCGCLLAAGFILLVLVLGLAVGGR